MLEYNVVAKRQHAHGSSARCKDAEITLDTDVKGRLPETTPVLEASALQDDLRRARIEPFAWVIKGGLAAAQPRDLLLQARAAAEIPQIRKVKELLAKRVVLIPFQTDEPVGVKRLNSLAAGDAWRRTWTYSQFAFVNDTRNRSTA